MNKTEWIATNGIESWQEKMERKKNNYHYHVKSPKDKKINDISFKAYFYIPESFDWRERQDKQKEFERLTWLLQRRIRQWWNTQTDKPNIIVVDNYSKGTRDNMWPVNVNLSQLNLSKCEIDNFKEGAEKIIKDFREYHNGLYEQPSEDGL